LNKSIGRPPTKKIIGSNKKSTMITMYIMYQEYGICFDCNPEAYQLD